MNRKLAIAVAAGAGLRLCFYTFERNYIRKYNETECFDRKNSIERMKREFYDVLVIGGGVTGAGVALEASTRGLKCALIDSGDFAGQTSSKSTKLLHGGVRYLENIVKGKNVKENISLVFEALRERTIVMQSAQLMTNWVSIGIPVKGYFDLLYYYIGMYVYHAMAKTALYIARLGNTQIPRPWISFHIKDIFPWVKPEYNSCVMYYDGQMNDSRLCIEILLTAASEGYIEGMKGADLANYCSFEKPLGTQVMQGGVVKDLLSGEEFQVRARVVINCTGPFTDGTKGRIGVKSDWIVPSKGSHLVLDKKYTENNVGFLIPVTEDGRMIFVLPWHGKTLLGTTDSIGPTSFNPVISKEETDILIKELQRYADIDCEELKRNLLSSSSGERPLVKSDAGGTADLLRTHKVDLMDNGLISVFGGKWTIFRTMGQDAIKKAITVFGLTPTYRTRSSDFIYKRNHGDLNTMVEQLINECQLGRDVAEHMVEYYGNACKQVVELGKDAIVDGYEFIEGEILYAVRQEFAVFPIDFLARRSRLAFLDYNAAVKAVPKVVEIMGKELAWDKRQCEILTERTLSELKSFSISK